MSVPLYIAFVVVALIGAVTIGSAWAELRGAALWGAALTSPALGLGETATASVRLSGDTEADVHVAT